MGHGIIRAGVLALMLGMTAPASAYQLYGGDDCGQWIKQNSASGRAWLMGYLSGLNAFYAATNPNTDPLGKTNSAQQIIAWMDNYCRANPLKTTDQGALQLFFNELVKK